MATVEIIKLCKLEAILSENEFTAALSGKHFGQFYRFTFIHRLTRIFCQIDIFPTLQQVIR